MALVMTETKSSDFKSLISRFKIPIELLDDIIYCQRSLRHYMRVHQILVARLPDKLKAKQLEEIERDICDIGREQNTLIARLRSMLELYYMSIINENVEIDREIGNAYVSRILSYHIENGNSTVIPKIVKKRLNEMQLLAHYGLHDLKRKPESTYKFDCKQTASNNLKQESLLKPKSERFALQKATTYPYGKADIKTEGDGSLSAASPSINNSRLNLLQALNKARNQSLKLSKPPRSPPALVVDTKETIEISSSQSSTTSDDSLDVPLVSPAFSEDETEVSQEVFLRKFGLYTVEYSRYLQQKRSQRRRRNVQSNEKSDYHYGKLDMFEKMNKRKKTYLHSPPATRAGKRRRMEKDGEGTTSKSSSTDRSTSSSPDQKLVCCECNKSENLSKCDTCLNFYHKQCHKSSAPKLIVKKICPECYIKLKVAKEAKNSREMRNSRESKEAKGDKEAKESNSRGSKYSKDDVDLGIAPLDHYN